MKNSLLAVLLLLAGAVSSQSCGVYVGGSYRDLSQVPTALLSIPELDLPGGNTFAANWSFSLCTPQTTFGCSTPSFVQEFVDGSCGWPYNIRNAATWSGNAILLNYTTTQTNIALQVAITCGSTFALQPAPGTFATFNMSSVATIQVTSSIACTGAPQTLAPQTLAPSSSCGVYMNGNYVDLTLLPPVFLPIAEIDVPGNSKQGANWSISLCATRTSFLCTAPAFVQEFVAPYAGPGNCGWPYDTVLARAWTGSAIVLNYTTTREPSTIVLQVSITCGGLIGLQVQSGTAAVLNTATTPLLFTLQLTSLLACSQPGAARHAGRLPAGRATP